MLPPRHDEISLQGLVLMGVKAKNSIYSHLGLFFDTQTRVLLARMNGADTKERDICSAWLHPSPRRYEGAGGRAQPATQYPVSANASHIGRKRPRGSCSNHSASKATAAKTIKSERRHGFTAGRASQRRRVRCGGRPRPPPARRSEPARSEACWRGDQERARIRALDRLDVSWTAMQVAELGPKDPHQDLVDVPTVQPYMVPQTSLFHEADGSIRTDRPLVLGVRL